MIKKAVLSTLILFALLNSNNAMAKLYAQDAHQDRLYEEAKAFHTWLDGRKAIITEFGLEQRYDNDEYLALGNFAFDVYNHYKFGMTNWTVGAWYPSSYETLSHHWDDTTKSLIDTTLSDLYRANLGTDDYIRGINISGAEGAINPDGINSDDQKYQYTPSDWKYHYHEGYPEFFQDIADAGYTHVRFAFRLERLFNVGTGDYRETDFYGSVDERDRIHLEQAIENARQAGLKMIIEPHNYGGVVHNGQLHILGFSTVFTEAKYATMMRNLTSLAMDNDDVITHIELMNEPKLIPYTANDGGDAGSLRPAGTSTKNWEVFAQNIFDEIVAEGWDGEIIVPTGSWQGMQDAPTIHPDGFNITDSRGKTIIFSPHHYHDANHSGSYQNDYATDEASIQGMGYSEGETDIDTSVDVFDSVRIWGTANADLPDSDDNSVVTTGETTVKIKFRLNELNNAVTEGSEKYVNFFGKGEYGLKEWLFRYYNEDSSTRPQRMSFYHFNETGGLGAGSYVQEDVAEGEVVTLIGRVNTASDRISLAKNGTTRDTDTLSGYSIVPTNTDAPVRFGRIKDSYAVDSTVDIDFIEFKQWDRELSDAEVAQEQSSGDVTSGLVEHRTMIEEADYTVTYGNAGGVDWSTSSGDTGGDGQVQPPSDDSRIVHKDEYGGTTLTINDLEIPSDLSDTVLIVGVSSRNLDTVTSVTHNGTAMTKIGESKTSYEGVGVATYALQNPEAGTHNIVLNGEYKLYSMMAMYASDVQEVDAIVDDVTGWGETASDDILAGAGSLVVDMINLQEGTTITAGQTEIVNEDNPSANLGTFGVQTYSPTEQAQHSMSWNWSGGTNFAHILIELTPTASSSEVTPTVGQCLTTQLAPTVEIDGGVTVEPPTQNVDVTQNEIVRITQEVADEETTMQYLDFKLFVKDKSGIKWEIPFISLSWTEELNNDRNASFTVTNQALEDIAERYGVTGEFILSAGYREIEIYDYDDNLVYTGIVDEIMGSGGKGEQGNKVVSSRGFFSLFTKRYTSAYTHYEDIDAGEIGWNLINDTQSKEYGDFGVVRGSIEETKTRDRTYKRRNIKEAIQALTSDEVAEGFEFDIDNYKNYNVFVERGDVREEIIFDSECNIDNWQVRKTGLLGMANHVIVFGEGSGDDMIVVEEDAENSYKVQYGLLEDGLSDKDNGDEELLSDKGIKYLDLNKYPSKSVSFDHFYAFPLVTTYNVGDTVQVRISEDGVDMNMRVIKRTINMDGRVSLVLQQ